MARPSGRLRGCHGRASPALLHAESPAATPTAVVAWRKRRREIGSIAKEFGFVIFAWLRPSYDLDTRAHSTDLYSKLHRTMGKSLSWQKRIHLSKNDEGEPTVPVPVRNRIFPL